MQRNPETCQLMDELETLQDKLLADLDDLNKQIERLLVQGQLSVRSATKSVVEHPAAPLSPPLSAAG